MSVCSSPSPRKALIIHPRQHCYCHNLSEVEFHSLNNDNCWFERLVAVTFVCSNRICEVCAQVRVCRIKDTSRFVLPFLLLFSSSFKLPIRVHTACSPSAPVSEHMITFAHSIGFRRAAVPGSKQTKKKNTKRDNV